MSICKEHKIKLGQYIDDYMHRYLTLRSKGHRSDDAIEEIHRAYVESAGRNWDDMSLTDQIMQWGSLSFADQMGSLDPSDVEEHNIVRGIKKSIGIALPIKQADSKDCVSWALDYLVRKYNIGGPRGRGRK